MTNPVGWVGTRADGTSVVFAGAKPNETYASQFASLSEIDTSADLEAAIATSQATAPTLTLAQSQSRQAAVLSSACAAAISSGFTSSALGAPHTYPSTPLDQQNLCASVTATLLPGLPAGWTTPFWVQDPTTGMWTFAPHTAIQIQQAGLDGKAAVIAAQNKLVALQAQVAAASTPAAVAGVIWA